MAWTPGVTTGATMASEFNALDVQVQAIDAALVTLDGDFDTLLAGFDADVDARIALADLADLLDVVVTAPANGHLLSYDFANTRWINQAPSFAAAIHSHIIADVTGLQAALDAKLPNRSGHSPFAPVAGLFVPNAANATALGTQAQVADRTIIAPFVPAYGMTIDQLGISVSTLLAASNCKGVIFDTDANGRPTTLLRETANISSAANATVFSTAFTPLVLVAGKTYWIGVRASGIQTLRTLAVGALPALDYTNAATPAARQVLIRTETFATGATAWSYASSQHSTALMPLVLMRVA